MKTNRGRPPLPESDRAEERLELRIKATDKTDWQNAADQAGVALSAWIRDRLSAVAKRELRKASRSS